MASSRVLLAATCGLLAACTSALPGHYFELTLETAQDGSGAMKDDCKPVPTPIRFDLTYRLVRAGADVDLFVDDARFASGTLDGTTLTYASHTWTERRAVEGSGDAFVKWSASGVADIRFEGSGAWSGKEWIFVSESDDPEVRSGCEVEYNAVGKLVDLVE